MIGFKKILIWDKHEKKHVLGPESFLAKNGNFLDRNFDENIWIVVLSARGRRGGKIHKLAFEGNILGGKICSSLVFSIMVRKKLQLSFQNHENGIFFMKNSMMDKTEIFLALDFLSIFSFLKLMLLPIIFAKKYLYIFIIH